MIEQKMKIFLLSDANSVHTIKWVKGLTEKGVHIALWSIAKPKDGIYEGIPNLKIYYSAISQERFNWYKKAKYLSLLTFLKRCIRSYQPDIVHSHYASSYGLLGALCNYHPFIVSVWGSDIYDFPNKNGIFSALTRFVLRRADKVLSTSHVMAEEASKYTSKEIEVTPFGIDLDTFKPLPKTGTDFVVGTIKTLEEKYGLHYLIEAFKIFSTNSTSGKIKLIIVGGGSQEQQLKQQARDLGISHLCDFIGPVPYEEVPHYHNQIDVCVCLSNNESFGVAAIEASATERPVVVSDVGGLPEVIVDNVTGVVVPAQDPKSAAEAIKALHDNPDLRVKMGKAGRQRVIEQYDWNKNVDKMIRIYNDLTLTRIGQRYNAK